jgi:2-polyprenyl-3-methyl-5-hydroxy-6-metoxy-1,4-benzoquinol methylase
VTRPADAVAWHSENAGSFDAKYASSRAFQDRVAVWAKLIEKYTRPDTVALDAGCGSGVLTLIAARRARAVLGVDASRAMIALAEAKTRKVEIKNVSFRVSALDDLQLPDEHDFDLILSSSVFEYVADYWKTFDLLASRLAPCGTIIFSLPNGESLYRKAERRLFHWTGRPAYYAYVRHMPTLGAVREALAARSFAIRESRYYAAAPGLSRIARMANRPQLADNLFVVACTREPAIRRSGSLAR